MQLLEWFILLFLVDSYLSGGLSYSLHIEPREYIHDTVYNHTCTYAMANCKIQYSSEALHTIRANMGSPRLPSQLMSKLNDLAIVPRRRGTRAGIQNKTRHTKTFNFSYPYGLSSNVNSLQGKFVELEQTITNMRNLCFITLQETKLQKDVNKWINETPQHIVPDEAIQMNNY